MTDYIRPLGVPQSFDAQLNAMLTQLQLEQPDETGNTDELPDNGWTALEAAYDRALLAWDLIRSDPNSTEAQIGWAQALVENLLAAMRQFDDEEITL